MKYIIVIFILIATSVNGQTGKSDTLKTYYYMWTANHGTNTAWGENDIQLNHRPIKAEIKKMVNNLEDDWWVKKYLVIEEVLEFNSEKEFALWHSGQHPEIIAYDISRYRR